MTEQGTLLALMIENELKKHQGFSYFISNHLFNGPKSIKLESDEIAFVTFIRIEASSDFVFNYSSATESRKIDRIITTSTIVENNIITKHHSGIKFNISNSDKYQVSIVKLKIIK